MRSTAHVIDQNTYVCNFKKFKEQHECATMMMAAHAIRRYCIINYARHKHLQFSHKGNKFNALTCQQSVVVSTRAVSSMSEQARVCRVS